MRIAFVSIFFFLLIQLNGQITQLNPGTTLPLNYLSVIEKNILIGSYKNYLAKSYHKGEQLFTLTVPGPSINYSGYQRLDSNNIFLVSNGNGSTLYRSYDGGNNWVNKYTNGYGFGGIAFFDTLEAIATIDLGTQLLRTYDGGVTWTTTPTSPVWATNNYKTFGDSTIIWAGICSNFLGCFFLSHDRGHTWPIAWSMGGSPSDFSFLNKDTILGVSSPLGNTDPTVMITKTINGGSAWTNSFAPIQYPVRIFLRSANECYIIGKDNGNAVIAKSIDLGQTWSKFDTGLSGQLIQMAFLNDSIALLTGDPGLLLRWNYKNSVFTGINDLQKEKLNFNVFPNPVTTKLTISSNSVFNSVSASLSNVLGQVVYTYVYSGNEHTIDLENLKPGAYFLKLQNQNGSTVMKIIKEQY